MEVTVDLNKEDFWRFNRYVMFHLPKYRVMMWAALAAIPVLSIVLLKFSGFGWVYSVVVGVLLGILCDFLFVYRIKSRTMRMVKHTPGMLGERRITMDSSAIHEVTGKSQLRYPWNGIHELRRDEEYLFVFVNPLQAVIIPRRSFTNGEEEDSYIKAIEGFSKKRFI
ncbi:YcxB family protein [Paenibacillus lemnae]|uniref:YcxB family protein n=1 Tax=Paenibacillus lemnae TaxID=1330551 RepID=A0A848M834_PAELE|nr:YcxB family protein [Paenibacillus lemnae]NMO97187.1 YcxB family protein [Paenibacillus lemnae]